MKSIIIGVMSIPLLATASLPYSGSEQNCTTSINQPQTEYMSQLDNGYEVDKDCKTIFVLPPKRGNAIVTSAHALAAPFECKNFLENRKELILANEYNRDISSLIRNVENAEQRQEYITIRQENYNYIQFLKDLLDEGKNTIGLKAKMFFEHDWDKLTQAYKEANQDSSFVIKRTPLTASILSITTYKKPDDITNLEQPADNGIYSIDLPGINLESSTALQSMIGQDTGSSNAGHYIFRGGLSTLVSFNLYGSCDLISGMQTLPASLNQISDSIQDTNVTANLTTWYSVQLDRSYKVKIDVEKVSKKLVKLIRTKTTFSNTEVIDLFDSTNFDQSIEIELSSSHVNDEENLRGIEEDIRIQVMDDIVTKILNTLADAVPDSLTISDIAPPTDPHIYVSRRVRHCRTRRRLFSRSKKCHTREYKVKEAYTGSARSIKESILNFSLKYNESTSYLSTVHKNTTLGFVNNQ